jgi:hypothetical protein
MFLKHRGGGVLAERGAQAALGVAIAVGAAAMTFALRWTLGRKLAEQGETRARDHA